MEELKPNLYWYERLDKLAVNECEPLGDESVQNIYSAIKHKPKLFKNKKFRVSDTSRTVCRIK